MGLLSEITARHLYVTAARMRVDADTSVIGDCEDDEFSGPSRRLMNRFIRGEMTLALSSLTLRELEAAPKPVRKVLERVPSEHTEMVDLSDDAEKLAAQYIDRGVISSRMIADALHIAVATVAGVDVLVSWNFKHVVN